MLYRPDTNAETVSRYLDSGVFPGDPKGDTSGIPELDGFVQLAHLRDGMLWLTNKRVTDDPNVSHFQSILQVDGKDWTFKRPLKYIGLVTDGGALTEDSLIGHFLFSNVRYNDTYQKLTDFPNRMVGSMGGSASTFARDRSSLAGICATDLGSSLTLVPSGISRAGFGANAYYAQRVTVRNDHSYEVKVPLFLKLENLNETSISVTSPAPVKAACQTPISNAVSIPLPNGKLGAFESTQVFLYFRNPQDKQIIYTPKVVGYGKL